VNTKIRGEIKVATTSWRVRRGLVRRGFLFPVPYSLFHVPCSLLLPGLLPSPGVC